MKLKLVRAARVLALLCVVSILSPSSPAANVASRPESSPPGVRTVELVQTNWSTRYVTNVIEVRAPQNVFVNEYRTNLTQRSVTNMVAVDVFRTNFFVHYQTNLLTRTVTNQTTLSLTNWVTRTVTNQITLTLTNWETVVATRTNWIRQPMTNFIEVSVPVNAVVSGKEAPAQPASATAAANDSLVLEAVKTAKPTDNNQVELKFRIRLASDSAATLQVQQWRVEREDGAVFFFAQEQEFKRVLPTGRYQINVKARRDADSPVLSLKGSLDVTRDAVARR